jgi:hypothetical protein
MGFQKVPGQRQEQGFSKMGITEYMHWNSRIYAEYRHICPINGYSVISGLKTSK